MGDNKSDDEGAAVGILLSFVIVWNLLIICFKIRHHVRSRRNTLRIHQTHVDDDREAKKEKHKKLRRTLPLKVWKQENNDDIALDVDMQSQRQTNERLHNGESDQQHGNSVQECPICLTDFDDGCSICHSLNPSCNHIFHFECMLEWLLEHDECPCCRVKYILETASA